MFRFYTVIVPVVILAAVTGVYGACRSYDADEGARCDIRMWPGEPEGRSQWESRVLLRENRIRLINRRAKCAMDPGPEELLWNGSGIIQFMGGRASPFEPDSRLSVSEVYFLIELFGSLWEQKGSTGQGGQITMSGPFGTGVLGCDPSGYPNTLVISEMSRTLWNGSADITVQYSGATKGYPWQYARIEDSSKTLIATFERVRFTKQSLSDDMFSVEDEGGLRLADLSSPVDNLLGSQDGEYTETAGAQGLRDLSGTAYAGGDAYMGYVPTTDEVDAFMRTGGLGRYGDNE